MRAVRTLLDLLASPPQLYAVVLNLSSRGCHTVRCAHGVYSIVVRILSRSNIYLQSLFKRSLHRLSLGLNVTPHVVILDVVPLKVGKTIRDF